MNSENTGMFLAYMQHYIPISVAMQGNGDHILLQWLESRQIQTVELNQIGRIAIETSMLKRAIVACSHAASWRFVQRGGCPTRRIEFDENIHPYSYDKIPTPRILKNKGCVESHIDLCGFMSICVDSYAFVDGIICFTYVFIFGLK
jgi:hypothetical protein